MLYGHIPRVSYLKHLRAIVRGSRGSAACATHLDMAELSRCCVARSRSNAGCRQKGTRIHSKVPHRIPRRCSLESKICRELLTSTPPGVGDAVLVRKLHVEPVAEHLRLLRGILVFPERT